MTPTEITKLWDFLSQTWGNKFLEEYGKKPNDAWRMALANVEPEAARFAIRGLIHEGQPFAPTLPEFIGYCRRYRPLPEPTTQIEHKPSVPREVIRDGLDRLRRELGLPPRNTKGPTSL